MMSEEFSRGWKAAINTNEKIRKKRLKNLSDRLRLMSLQREGHSRYDMGVRAGWESAAAIIDEEIEQ